MTVQVIALVTINENEPLALAAYLAATQPLLKQVGAKILRRFALSEAVIGEKPAESVIIVEYPSREAVDLVFGSDIYRSIIPMRDRAFSKYQISIAAD